MNLETAFAACPLVAILRGLTPEEAIAVGEALVDAGFTILEVPLNSPRPLESIAALSRHLKGRAIVGAGTVLTATAAEEVVAAGGELIVMPHADTAVIARAKALGAACVPGIATPTEAFAALAAGADALKIFPAELVAPKVVKAMLAVLPKGVKLLPVGGITPETMEPYRAAGAAGFGLGSALYAPGTPPAEVGTRARAFIAALGAK
ncbi:2-dehydro-3-deoxy-6-phosphogalactonate aldolase [Frigidibacter sp. MR17.24]|uniref:2-dehydro-3-deoxy-6-phosphogalactonate aldolase n=1 Tax=Frigidibacter sp. MR17.24 TaxID=3127345 RepID=UPI003012BA6D